jgi:hypothetical protein
MTARKIRYSITVVAVAAVLAHLVRPQLAIDGISVMLILVAILPWLAPLFKSIELPGGLKIEYKELEKAEERADKAGLLTTATTTTTTTTPLPGYSFQVVVEEDPNLALAGLRIEIERRLRQIANSRGIGGGNKGIGQLLRVLTDKQLLTVEERLVLADMVNMLNSAVHGAVVDPRAASWAFQVGPRLLQSLGEIEQRYIKLPPNQTNTSSSD